MRGFYEKYELFEAGKFKKVKGLENLISKRAERPRENDEPIVHPPKLV
jgi:hypothetical protein